jgi:hypothetical protein
MICICREFDLWPPTFAVKAKGYEHEDEDAAHVCTIAQRLYDDEQLRLDNSTDDEPAARRRRAATASFIVDFAVAARYEVASISISPALETFRQRVVEWQQLQCSGGTVSQRRPRPTELEDISTTSSSDQDENADGSMVERLARSVSNTPDNMRRWLAKSISPFTDLYGASKSFKPHRKSKTGVVGRGKSAVTSQAAHDVVKVFLPENVTIGMQIAFTAPNGQCLQFDVTEGMRPGSIIDVICPSLISSEQVSLPGCVQNSQDASLA